MSRRDAFEPSMWDTGLDGSRARAFENEFIYTGWRMIDSL